MKNEAASPATLTNLNSDTAETHLPRKLTFPFAGPGNGLDQSALPLFGYEPALSREAPVKPLSTKLYLVPRPISFDGEELDPDIQPQPTPLSELPELDQWVSRYVRSLIEIWSGRRASMQLARWTHRDIFNAAIQLGMGRKALPKIRNIYISQPIDGVGEVTVTLRYDERVRSLVMRFEGVDHRWLCTELTLI